MLQNAPSSAHASWYRPAGRGWPAATLNTVCGEEPGEYRALPPTGPRLLAPAGRPAPIFGGQPAPVPGRSPAAPPTPQPSPAPPRQPREVSLGLADALALSVRAALERVAIPLARAVAAFTLRRCWEDFGFARLEDHARERFGRSGRWVNDCAALGRALESLPPLAAALTGEDGGRPIGRVAATLVGRVATPESAGAWLAAARAVPVRLLREAVRAARAAGSVWPQGTPGAACPQGDPGSAWSQRSSDSAWSAPEPHAGGLESAARSAGLDDDGASDVSGAFEDQDAPASRESRTFRASRTIDDHGAATDDLSERSLVRILVPAPVLAAFDEAVDLHRCVEGREASVTSFVEHLVAEACAAGFPPDADRAPMTRSPDVAAVESALARSTDNWSHLAPSSPASWSLALAGVSLARLREIDQVAGTGGAADLDGQIRALLALEDDLQGRLAFAGVGHYAEERLGISRTTAEDRVRAARALRRFPLLRAAFEAGRVGFEATILILRILGRGSGGDPVPGGGPLPGGGPVSGGGPVPGVSPVDATLEAAWVARAEAATVKRLRDEARAIGRRGLEIGRRGAEADPRNAPGLGQPGSDGPSSIPRPRFPLDDATWHASLYRAPGTARDRLHRFGMAAAEAPSPDVFLRIRLPHDLAADFLGAVESARARHSGLVDSVPWDEPWPDPDAPPSVIAARTFSVASRRVPAWIGLLALLEDFVQTWDPVTSAAGAGTVAASGTRPGPETSAGPVRRPGDAVYARAGWRCSAPGCTSRRNLEDHHVVYRSRGGRDDLSNRICLCRFHHQRGEHGDLASCRGRAPLGIVWRLGRTQHAVWYRNEMVRSAPGSLPPPPVLGSGPIHGGAT